MTYTRDTRVAAPAVLKASRVFEKLGYKPEIVGEKGHDIVLSDTRKVEVKYDTWIMQTGNIAYEWWSNKDKRAEGWGRYCDADILVYFLSFDCAYVLDMRRLKPYVLRNHRRFVEKPTPLSKASNLMVHISRVRQFRIKELEAHFWDAWYDSKIRQARSRRRQK